MRIRLMFFVSAVFLLASVNSASAVTWTNAYPWSVLWDDERNWDPAVVPGPCEMAYINPPPEQGPVIDSDVTVGGIRGPRYDSDSNQVMHVLTGSVVVNGSWEFGDSGSGTSFIYFYGDSNVTVGSSIWHREGNAAIYVGDSAVLTANYQMRLSDFGSAILDMSGDSTVVINGDLIAADGNSGWFEAHISGGSLFVGGTLNVGREGGGIIDMTGGTVDCNVFKLQMRSETSTGALNVGGADVYVGETLQINDGNGIATMNMMGGDVNTGELWLAGGDGSATLNMFGGSLIVRGAFRTPADSNGIAGINLNGGTVGCGSFTHAGAYAMDIEDGVLIIDNNVVDAVLADVEAGYITAYDTAGYVIVDFNNYNSSRTTVQAVPDAGLVPVPNVADMNQGAAETIIANVGLTVGEVTEQYSDAVPAGSVVSQHPAARTLAAVGSPVDLVVSLGSPFVPYVVGMMEADANSAVNAAALIVGTVVYEYNDTEVNGVVIGQNPAGGTVVPVGSSVDLVVSLGRPLVPNVFGLTQADAAAAIEAVDDLTVGAVTFQYDNAVPVGFVVFQAPPAGTAVAIGSMVDLMVSLGRPVVPDVVGMAEFDAITAIEANSLVVGTVNFLYSDIVPAGIVVGQNPPGGVTVLVGSAVDLVVSLGLPTVPEVVGETEGVAVTAIEAVDSLIAAATYEHHNSIPADTVISQYPLGGTVVAIGAVVDILVSLGRPAVPDIVGWTEAVAVAAIEAVDDLTSVAAYEYHDTAPVGTVISQNPAGDTQVDIGTVVSIAVSLGRPMVPCVVGLGEVNAVSAIEGLDNLTAAVTYEYDNVISVGNIISQSPVCGTMVDVGTTVNIAVSLGRPAVPDVVGWAEVEAVSAIEAIDGLTAAATYDYHNTVPAGRVVSQNPSGGTTVDVGTPVSVVISLGQPVVPGVVGEGEANAVLAIQAVDNLMAAVIYEYHDIVPAGCVISQYPVGETAVVIGTAVDVVVSSGRPIVPDVVGRAEANAVSAIEAVDNLTVEATYEYHDSVPAGEVIAQNPVGGAAVDVNTTVNILVSLGQTPAMVLGVNRLLELQNSDGGWDRPLDDGDPNNGSDPETFAAVMVGLARAYRRNRQISEPNMLAALQKAKIFLLSKTDDFVAADGALAVELDNILGGTGCADYVTTNFYDKLEAGTYYDANSDAIHNTSSYIQAIRDRRFNEGKANLAAWDLGVGLYSANVIGANTTEWIVGVKAEIDEMNGSQWFDVLGLAGAVLGLAAVGEDYDPQGGLYVAASSLSDLVAILASYQLGTGGFTWHWMYRMEGTDEVVQETVYALMALNRFDRAGYLTQISDAGNYLQSVQLETGGWENHSTGGERNQTTGEALWGITVVVPPLGDFDKDGDVDLKDFAILASAWLTRDGDARWNPDCNISLRFDDSINMLDVVVFVDNWLMSVR